MKPIIGITVEPTFDPENDRSRGKLRLNWNYAEAIAEAGGVPILIPPTADPAEIAKLIHGFLIPGGLDIDAAEFGEANHPSVEAQDPSRFRIEKALLEQLDKDVPVLGICYGCQFLNVARGGTLEQHVPDVVGDERHQGGTWEQVPVAPDSKLASLLASTEVEGRSYHHQAIKQVGKGLVVTARAADGTIEAIEDPDKPFYVAVQWHPERSYKDEGNRRLVEGFVAAARTYAGRQKVGA